MSGRTGRRSHATEKDHRQQMLRMLDDRDVVRRTELDKFSRVLRNDDDVDVDSPCPIFDAWYMEGGADAVSRLTVGISQWVRLNVEVGQTPHKLGIYRRTVLAPAVLVHNNAPQTAEPPKEVFNEDSVTRDVFILALNLGREVRAFSLVDTAKVGFQPLVTFIGEYRPFTGKFIAQRALVRNVVVEAYAQRENRLRAIGNTIKTKRRLSQDKYRSRKRLRHRMTLDDLPGHDDLICDSDDTQLPGY